MLTNLKKKLTDPNIENVDLELLGDKFRNLETECKSIFNYIYNLCTDETIETYP